MGNVNKKDNLQHSLKYIVNACFILKLSYKKKLCPDDIFQGIFKGKLVYETTREQNEFSAPSSCDCKDFLLLIT